MQKALWIIPALFLYAASGAPAAHADTYTPTFSCTGTCTSVPSAPNVTFNSHTEITVTWDDVPFLPLGLPVNFAPTDTYSWQGLVATGAEGHMAEFDIVDITLESFAGLSQVIEGNSPMTPDVGVLTFTAVSTPEPSTVGLMLLGIGIMLVMQKRFAKGLHQAS
jgi:hypothetical protein